MSYDNEAPDFEAIARYYNWLEQCHNLGAVKGRALSRKAIGDYPTQMLPDYYGQPLAHIRRSRRAAIAANAFLPILPTPSTEWLRFDCRYVPALRRVMRDAIRQVAYRERAKFALEIETVDALAALHLDHPDAGIDFRMEANGTRVTRYNFDCALDHVDATEGLVLGRALS